MCHDSLHNVNTEVVEEGRTAFLPRRLLQTALPPFFHLRRRSRRRPRRKGRQGHLVGLSRPLVVEVLWRDCVPSRVCGLWN